MHGGEIYLTAQSPVCQVYFGHIDGFNANILVWFVVHEEKGCIVLSDSGKEFHSNMVQIKIWGVTSL